MKRDTPSGRKKRKQKVRYLRGNDARPARDADGMACSCGGYADIQHDMTEKEIGKVQFLPFGMCGRPYRCCARAFKCRLCKTRLIVNAHAPEIG